MMSIRETAIRCIKEESQALLGLIPLINDTFDSAIEQILNCKGHLVITGVGKSGHVGAKMAATLASTGTPSFYINPLDALHGDLGMIVDEDIVLFISNSGNTDELLQMFACLQDRGISTIAMTGNESSLLAQYCHTHILVKVPREACPLNLAPTSSTTAVIAMGDAIACALMEQRNFRAKDFAMFHPAGNLGRKLLTKVKDVMYTNNLPVLPPNMKLSDAIIHISNGKLGLGIILEENKVIGIITDGDIRRAVEGGESKFFNLEVKDIMTINPKTISAEAKLTDIQTMFRKHKIHSLIVVNSENNLIGIVDYFAIMN
jgi:arabinose-5-phosphate isomerase